MGGFSQIPTTPKMILNFSGKYVNLRKMGKYEWHLAQLVVLVVNCGGNYLSTYKAFVRAHACEIGRTKARQVLAVDALEQFLYMMIFQPLIDLSHALAYAVHWPFTAGSSIFHGGADRLLRKVMHGLMGSYAFSGRDSKGWDGSVAEELQTTVCSVLLQGREPRST